MSSQPGRSRSSAPAAEPQERTGPSEARIRLSWALLLVGLVSLAGNVAAALLTWSAIVRVGPPQGPLDFAAVLGGALLGLLGDVLICRGCLKVIRPEYTLGGGEGAVAFGLILQIPAGIASGALTASSDLTAGYVAFWVVLTGLWLWSGFGRRKRARGPVAQHATEQPAVRPPTQPNLGRAANQPFPWVGPGNMLPPPDPLGELKQPVPSSSQRGRGNSG